MEIVKKIVNAITSDILTLGLLYNGCRTLLNKMLRHNLSWKACLWPIEKGKKSGHPPPIQSPPRYTKDTNSTLAHKKVGHQVPSFENRGGELKSLLQHANSPHTTSVQSSWQTTTMTIYYTVSLLYKNSYDLMDTYFKLTLLAHVQFPFTQALYFCKAWVCSFTFLNTQECVTLSYCSSVWVVTAL
jgi:hypothetical protein